MTHYGATITPNKYSEQVQFLQKMEFYFFIVGMPWTSAFYGSSPTYDKDHAMVPGIFVLVWSIPDLISRLQAIPNQKALT
jgi:hypothetical protein